VRVEIGAADPHEARHEAGRVRRHVRDDEVLEERVQRCVLGQRRLSLARARDLPGGGRLREPLVYGDGRRRDHAGARRAAAPLERPARSLRGAAAEKAPRLPRCSHMALVRPSGARLRQDGVAAAAHGGRVDPREERRLRRHRRRRRARAHCARPPVSAPRARRRGAEAPGGETGRTHEPLVFRRSRPRAVAVPETAGGRERRTGRGAGRGGAAPRGQRGASSSQVRRGRRNAAPGKYDTRVCPRAR